MFLSMPNEFLMVIVSELLNTCKYFFQVTLPVHLLRNNYFRNAIPLIEIIT